MKNLNSKLIIGLLGLILCLCGQSCQKEEHTPINLIRIDHQEQFEGRSGLAPFLNLSELALDSTQVTSSPTWVQFNGAKIVTIQATASGGQPAIYLNISYNHYNNCTITFVDGTQWVHNKPIYISHPISGNLILSGPLTNWSGLKADHPEKLVRYVNSGFFKPSYIPMQGITWRLYTWIVNGQRMELYPISKEYRTFRLF